MTVNGSTRVGLGRILVVLTTLIAALVLPAAVSNAAPVPAPAAPQMVSFDKQMIALINKARTDRGLPALQEARGLTSVSLYWSNQMNAGATGYKLAHNPNAWTQVAENGASNRTTWGENVAWSSSTSTPAQEIFDAYMASPGHRANILGSAYRYVGMGTVGGSRGLWNTTEFTDKVESGQVVSTPSATPTVSVKEGDFVYDEGSRLYYRIAGGAPVVVSSWTSFGGIQPYKRLTAAQFNKLPDYPRDGTFVADRGTGVVYRIAGGAPIFVTSWAQFGGVKSVTWIDGAAIRYANKGGAWNHLLWYPRNETFIIASGSSTVYRVLWGKLHYLSSWSSVGGVKPTTVVDKNAIAKAGSGGAYNHLKK
ncbi:hypothetical protein GIS00_09255 [Nakamurella sp. YIM 132087]|uniref:SCP domain-containing protein n=1 Tax=Nakamurella alba TaxID=2665158 RepID=A0A7K1FJ26_9ACTN|nr:CAP domain-containing protein [Nakamurella alba]MTD14131.1 hypothetical protein [Nakamurella alba]